MKIKLKNTKLVDGYKRPILFYHTSPVENIERFYSLSHFGSKKSAQMRGMHYVYQALGIPEPAVLPDELPKSIQEQFSKLKNAPQLFTYPVYLYSRSVLKTPDLGKHSLYQYQRWFKEKYAPKSKFLTGKERLEGDGVGETKTAYKKALTEFIFVDPFTKSPADLEKELRADSLFEIPKNPDELPEKVAFGRMIRFLEGEGYDALIYKNDYEDKNKETYIVFRPEQVFRQEANETEHSLAQKENVLLEKIEKDFFEKRRILSPSQRIKNYQESLQQKINKTR